MFVLFLSLLSLYCLAAVDRYLSCCSCFLVLRFHICCCWCLSCLCCWCWCALRQNEVTSEPPHRRDGTLENLVPAAHKRLYRVNPGRPFLNRQTQHTQLFLDICRPTRCLGRTDWLPTAQILSRRKVSSTFDLSPNKDNVELSPKILDKYQRWWDRASSGRSKSKLDFVAR